MNEVLAPSPHLPDAFIGLPPAGREILENCLSNSERPLWRLNAALESLEHGIGDLAIDVGLPLLRSLVPNPDWRGLLIAWQPRNDQFRQPPLSAHPVHDLGLSGTACYSPKEPISPCPRLFV